jgi:Zn-finger nucleic acid-binding protein
MSDKKLEELIYEFGQIMYRLGRLETDGKQSQKEYNQTVKKREELTEIFDEFFGTTSKRLNV